MKKKGFILICVMLYSLSIVYSLPLQYHPAGEIIPGTFYSGNYTFPNNVEITGNLNITNNLSVSQLCINGECKTSISDIVWTENGSSTYLTIQNNKVGIGTTNPAYLLEVVGSNNWLDSITMRQKSNNDNGAVFRPIKQRGLGSAVDGDWIGGIEFNIVDSNLNVQNIGAIYGRSMNVTDNYETGEIHFFTRNQGEWTTRMIIREDGDVGIGTYGPELKLDVEGDIEVGTGTTGCVRDSDNTVIAGSCSSDIRLKENIVSLPNNTLDKVSSLRPVKFKWKSDGVEDYGLIAQEVETILPNLVETGEDGYKRVRYDVALNMHMLEAIKELKLKNDILIIENNILNQNYINQQEQINSLKYTICKKFPRDDLCK